MAICVGIEEVFVNVAHYASGDGEGDVDFADSDAIKLSKVLVTDMLYGYGASNIAFATFSGSDSTYQTGLTTNDRTAIIKNNIKSNSNGLN